MVKMDKFNVKKLTDKMGVYDVSLDNIDIPDVPIYQDISLAKQDLNFNDFTGDNIPEMSVLNINMKDMDLTGILPDDCR